jgi:hypothetical protein
MMIPSGLSSEAKLKDAKLCVQTEFAQRPKPRVTTTISRNGVVLEKVENAWEGPPRTEQERERIERFLRRQHQGVLARIKSDNTQSAAPSAEAEKTASTGQAGMSRIDRLLSETDGVSGWTHISGDGQVTAHHLPAPETKEISDLVPPLKDLSSFLTSVTGLGDFTGGILESPGSSELWLPLGADFLVVKAGLRVSFKNLVEKIKSEV